MSVIVWVSKVAAFLALSLWPDFSRAESLVDVVERLVPSVVGVGTAFPPRVPTGGRPAFRLLGSGFVVDHLGESFVVSNSHVVSQDLELADGEALAVFEPGARDAEVRVASIAARSELHDLVLLRYRGKSLPSARLSAEPVRPGERVAFTGFPIGAVLGLVPATQEGIVSAITPIARPADVSRDLSALQLRRMRNPFTVLQLDAIAYPGNSGSAVYRQSDGAVIGVMNSVFVKETREELLSTPSGIAFAIPVKHVTELFRTLKE